MFHGIRRILMSSKTKAFIGITVSVVFLIILFTAAGGYRASRDSEDTNKEETCAAEAKVCGTEAIAQVEAK